MCITLMNCEHLLAQHVIAEMGMQFIYGEGHHTEISVVVNVPFTQRYRILVS
jgi:hypothetical protein